MRHPAIPVGAGQPGIQGDFLDPLAEPSFQVGIEVPVREVGGHQARSPQAYWIRVMAASAAVATLRRRGPRLATWKPASRARAASPAENPPSGPMRTLTSRGRGRSRKDVQAPAPLLFPKDELDFLRAFQRRGKIPVRLDVGQPGPLAGLDALPGQALPPPPAPLQPFRAQPFRALRR